LSKNIDTIIELRAFTTWLGDDRICYTAVKPDAVIELEDALENTAAIKKISGDSVYPILVNLKTIRSITKEARNHFSMRNRTPGVTAIAFLIKSPSSRIIGNFFIGLNKPVVPTKLFTDKEAAIVWLAKFITTPLPSSI
jgi:hypothetical protein